MLERARRLLEAQRAQLDRLTAQQSGRFIDALKRTRIALRDSLELAGGANPAAPLTPSASSVLMAQVDTAIASLQARLGETYGEMATAAYELAARHVEEQLRTFAAASGFTAPPLQIEAAVALQDGLLLQHYQRSVATYGAELAQKAQAAIVEGTLRRQSWAAIERRIAGISGIFAQDYYGGNARDERRQSRAERIVRTEILSAYNRAHLLDSAALEAQDPGFLKQLVAVLDSRTGEDSIFVDGQIRAINKPFQDNQGRIYMHPPNRPNDREIVVLVRPEWVDAGLTAVDPSDDESRAALAHARRLAAATTGETTT